MKKKKILVTEEIPCFWETIKNMPAENRTFVDKSMEIAHFIVQVMHRKSMNQKELAEKMGRPVAEVNKWLSGMHNFTLHSLAEIEVALDCPILLEPGPTAIAAPANSEKSTLNKIKVVLDKAVPPKIHYVKVAKADLPHI